ncbi:MAG: SpoIID/LytB domain-containing protein [Planctomycetes bacterium]|nr:SpoIID/LytB domain-containing protein [Planctomycetota bacterium]
MKSQLRRLRHPGALLFALLLGIVCAVAVSELYKPTAHARHFTKSAGGARTEPAIVLEGEDPGIEVLLSALDGNAQVSFACAGGWIARDAGGREIGRTTGNAPSIVALSQIGRLSLRGGDTGSPFFVVEPMSNEPLQIGKYTYRGTAVFRAADRGVRVINRVSLEQYLVSVVGSEMYASSTAPAALEAQAIAARTYARYAIEELGRNPIPDSQEAQAYFGVSRETAATRAAVLATRSQILMFQGAILPAFYHSTCGGQTIDGSALIGAKAPPPLRGGPCGYCEHGKLYRWSVHVNQRTLSSICASFNIGKTCARVEPRGSAEDPWNSILLTGSAGQTVVSSKQLRQHVTKLTPNVNFPSPFVTDVEPDRDGVIIKGRGFGHGVGLCQIGAAEMGRRGFGAGQILQKYYPGAAVVAGRDGREVAIR